MWFSRALPTVERGWRDYCNLTAGVTIPPASLGREEGIPSLGCCSSATICIALAALDSRADSTAARSSKACPASPSLTSSSWDSRPVRSHLGSHRRQLKHTHSPWEGVMWYWLGATGGSSNTHTLPLGGSDVVLAGSHRRQLKHTHSLPLGGSDVVLAGSHRRQLKHTHTLASYPGLPSQLFSQRLRKKL